jgi:hypothetical protein
MNYTLLLMLTFIVALSVTHRVVTAYCPSCICTDCIKHVDD